MNMFDKEMAAMSDLAKTRERVVDGERQCRIRIARNVSDRGRAGIDHLFQAEMHAGKHGREREIGIGVSAGAAMFDAARIRRPHGNAQSGRTVVHTPVAIDGANMSG